MTYLIFEMLLCLLVAFLLGLLVGWWLGRHRRRDRLGRLEEKWRLKHEHARRRLEDCRQELEAAGEASAGAAADAEPAAADTATGSGPPAVSAAATAAAALADVPPAEPDDLKEIEGVGPKIEQAPEPDDLKKIEGIGPKIEGLLNASGIVTWAQLAAAEIDRLQAILDDAGPRYRVHDPGTWPQQAELAATGKWDELEELQGRLKGGRKA